MGEMQDFIESLEKFAPIEVDKHHIIEDLKREDFLTNPKKFALQTAAK